MIVELNIENFAVIENITLKFGPGMSVISGEEGTGKSLIIDALAILLGVRAPVKLIRHGKTTARVEGVFSLSPTIMKNISNILKDNDIVPETDGTLVISRDIHHQGKSVSRINGRAVTQSSIRRVGQFLVDIHGQLDFITILDIHHQLNLLDAYDNLNDLKNIYRNQVEQYREKIKELNTIENFRSDGKIELIKYQVEEIKGANINPQEETNLQNRLDILHNCSIVKESFLKACDALYDSDRSASSLIYEALTALKSHRSIDNNFHSQKTTLEECITNIEEVAVTLRKYSETVDFDAKEVDELEQRLNLLDSLKRKYGPTLEDVIKFYDKSVVELNNIESSQDYKRHLIEDIANLEAELVIKAEHLSNSRKIAAISLVKSVNEELSEVGLDMAHFNISFLKEESIKGLPCSDGKSYSFSKEGIDQIEFMISTNPGEPARPLRTIVSGGETSRIMLALKSVLKKVDPVPTLVFDEIDAGVGGRSGDNIGKKLVVLARQHQVVCITHLPQIACFADEHIKLSKGIKLGHASTSLELVQGQNRIEEIASMLGSNTIGKTMLKSAEILLDHAVSWKVKENNKCALSV